MWYSIVLTLHLLTAALTAVVILYALYILKYKKAESYHLCALVLGLIASFEVCTGVVLAQLSPNLSATSLSIHMLEYLGVCLFVEIILFMRIKKPLPTFSI